MMAYKGRQVATAVAQLVLAVLGLYLLVPALATLFDRPGDPHGYVWLGAWIELAFALVALGLVLALFRSKVLRTLDVLLILPPVAFLLWLR